MSRHQYWWKTSSSFLFTRGNLANDSPLILVTSWSLHLDSRRGSWHPRYRRGLLTSSRASSGLATSRALPFQVLLREERQRGYGDEPAALASTWWSIGRRSSRPGRRRGSRGPSARHDPLHAGAPGPDRVLRSLLVLVQPSHPRPPIAPRPVPHPAAPGPGSGRSDSRHRQPHHRQLHGGPVLDRLR